MNHYESMEARWTFFTYHLSLLRCFGQPGAVGGHLELKVAWKVSQGRKEMPQKQEEKIRKVGINFTEPYLIVFGVDDSLQNEPC